MVAICDNSNFDCQNVPNIFWLELVLMLKWRDTIERASEIKQKTEIIVDRPTVWYQSMELDEEICKFLFDYRRPGAMDLRSVSKNNNLARHWRWNKNICYFYPNLLESCFSTGLGKNKKFFWRSSAIKPEQSLRHFFFF